ncbi:phosphoglycolate phosphatase [Loktanella sp. IMCC34160]|uniref:phosphoglycolate phosphatase n=1 Tax=Loktanella sp. IMCC34160 TaxID=2510646 RepID=UPI00101C8461|nr:phosphoglycolate phosphatase [Loktanella sp. IMCC34160]RYG92312.1 phosphoglycolate phosphatase [Loktanella sp. IMCC34160]
MPAAIAFDLDGTLIDSLPDIRAAANAVLDPRGLPPLSYDEVRQFTGWGVDHFIGRLCDTRAVPSESRDALHAEFMTRYLTAHDETRLYPGVAEALTALRAAGHPLGLCTNKPSGPTAGVLAALGLSDTFDAVICGDSLRSRKPDPAPLLACFARMGAKGGLYVGDSEVDADTAEAADIPFLFFTEGYCKRPQSEIRAAARFAEFSTLPGLVEELG